MTKSSTSRKTKSGAVKLLLRRERGATIDEITQATGWKPHSCTPIPVPVCAPIDSEDATMALMLAHRQAPDWPAELWRDDSKVCSIKRKLVDHSEIWIIGGEAD